MTLFAYLFVPKTHSTNIELLYLIVAGSILCTEYIDGKAVYICK